MQVIRFHHGCGLPIQIFHFASAEIEPRMIVATMVIVIEIMLSLHLCIVANNLAGCCYAS